VKLTTLSVTLIALCALLSIAPRTASAKPAFGSEMEKTYPDQNATLKEHGCVECHVSSSDFGRNSYGKQIAAAMAKAKAKKLTPAILHKLDSRDADGDKATNLAEIEAGTYPGDAKSVPAAKSSRETPVPPTVAGRHSLPAGLVVASLVLPVFGIVLRRNTHFL
jgi:hypothetical protein